MSNSELIQGFLSIFFTQPEKIPLFCSNSVVLHWRGSPLIEGAKELTSFGESQKNCFSGFEFIVLDIVDNQKDKVAVRLMQSGRLQSEWETLSQFGAKFEIGEMMFFQILNGLITDIWAIPDMEEKKRQISMGVI